MRQEIRFCSSPDGTRIAYAVSGSGPPLVLTMSWVSHLEYAAQMLPWNSWLEALSREYTLLRFDTRGCGLSDRSVRDLSFEAGMADIESVVEAAGFKRFAMLGVCSGGPPAILYSVRHPQRVTDLVLYGTWGRGRYKRPEFPGEREKARVMSDLALLGWAQEGHAFLRAWASVFQPGGTAEHARGWCTLQKASTDAATAVELIRTTAAVDVLALANRLRCRTLIIHAERDAVAPLHEARLLAAGIPGARYVQLDSDNHILLAEEPAWNRFLAELRGFISDGGESDVGADAHACLATLTSRETEILDAMARGFGNAQIAALLGLSEKTVRNNVSRIFDKLDVATRASAIVLARDAGFGRHGGEGLASRVARDARTRSS